MKKNEKLDAIGCIKRFAFLAEAEKREVDKGRGVIKDSLIQERVLQEIRSFVHDLFRDSREIGIAESAIKGANGNREFFLGVQKVDLNRAEI